jgi:hypothetical protein
MQPKRIIIIQKVSGEVTAKEVEEGKIKQFSCVVMMTNDSSNIINNKNDICR